MQPPRPITGFSSATAAASRDDSRSSRLQRDERCPKSADSCRSAAQGLADTLELAAAPGEASAVRATEGDAAAGSRLRLLTLNIKSASGALGGPSRPEILDDLSAFLREQDPDVVVLEEVDCQTRRSGGIDQLSVLAQACQASDHRFAPAMRRQGGTYGVGILLRHGLRFADDRVQTRRLPSSFPAVEPRVALAGDVRLPDGTEVTVIGSHVSLSRFIGPRQIEALGDWAAEARDEGPGGADRARPVVLAGDFNRGPNVVRRRLAERGLADAFDVAAGRQEEPRRRSTLTGSVDHVYVGGEVQVDRVQVLSVPRRHPPRGWWGRIADRVIPRVATDHRAIIADLRLPPRRLETAEATARSGVQATAG